MKRIFDLIHPLFNRPKPVDLSRQRFLRTAGLGLITSAVGSILVACGDKTGANVKSVSGGGLSGPVPKRPTVSPPAEVPADTTKPIKLEPIIASTEQQDPPPPAPLPNSKRIGYALVGLGHLTLNELLPAFGTCTKSKVVALVSGSPGKMKKVAMQYGIKSSSCYSYENYDKLRDNPEVDAIYIVLPNGLHAEYTIRGAQAGKHILCEKPMANSVAECQAMIDACKKANRKLMVAYRIQYEPHHDLVRDMVQKQEFGKVKSIVANNGQNSDNPSHWRFNKELAGGGALPDVGIYCLNTIRYLLAEEPTEVMGFIHSTEDDPRFREVEEQVNWLMKFPSGVQTSCATGYGHHVERSYKVLAETGWIEMDPAFSYGGLQLQTSQADGRENRITQHNIASENQFAAEMDHFSESILRNTIPFTPGEEGMQDQKIMEAIYRSAREGKPVKLPTVEKKDAFRGAKPLREV